MEHKLSTENFALSPPVGEFEKIIDQRDRTIELMQEGLDKFAQAMAVSPGWLYSVLNNLNWYGDDLVAHNMKKVIKEVDIMAWNALFKKSNLTTVMNSEDVDKAQKDIQKNAPPCTREAVLPTFVDLFSKRHETFKKGLVDVFRNLSGNYRSHDPFLINKRIILDSAFSGSFWNSWSHAEQQVNDLNRIFLLLDGFDPGAVAKKMQISGTLAEARRAGEAKIETTYFECRFFKNGNIHLWLSRPDLVDKANKVIAEYCGRVLGHRN